MLKQVVSFVLLGFGGVAVLGGCPIYSDDRYQRVCTGYDCYACGDDYYSSDCRNYSCNDSNDCPTGYSCGSDARCHGSSTTPPPATGGICSKSTDCPTGSTCGADNVCHTGDCSAVGCSSGYVCKLSGGVASCQPIGTGTTDGGTPTSTCKNDNDCPTPSGSKCLSGQCVAPADQCVDGTQCAGDAQCVQGACTPTCSDTKPCSTGYSCDLQKGVCTQNPSQCGAGGTACGGSTVCVADHCVDPCGAGNTCASGLVCVDGGCVPDQKPVFTCTTDGVKDACQAGSICLRHSCYISCEGAASGACTTADKFNVCKTVTTSSGAHSVCGSADNLGTECDPTKACASPLVCIDGFCR